MNPIPGNIAFGGATFFGKLSGGAQFTGRFCNLIGRGRGQGCNEVLFDDHEKFFTSEHRAVRCTRLARTSCDVAINGSDSARTDSSAPSTPARITFMQPPKSP